MLDLARLGTVSAVRVGPVAMELLDKAMPKTKETVEEQAASLALGLLMVCRRHGAHPGDVLRVGQNLLERADGIVKPPPPRKR